MLGVYYIALATALGLYFCRAVFGRAIDEALNSGLVGAPIPLPRWMVVWPAAFCTGILLLTWCVYGVGLLCSGQPQPLGIANAAVIVGGTALLAALWWASRSRGQPWRGLGSSLWPELAVPVSFAVVGTALMWQSLRVTGNELATGVSVWSDFGPHLAVIRSFSHGQNFPTEYPHFPDGHARYHFLFQFLAGNLEYLGLRIDWAFNLPSILSLTAAATLLYAFAVAVTGSRLAGGLTLAFYFFRSSFAWIDFLGRSSWRLWPRLFWTTDEFIGRTEHEDWGLWNQNIILNQRHLAFSLALLWLVLLLMLPRLREFLETLRTGDAPAQRWPALRRAFASAEAWLPGQDRRSLILAIVLGGIIGLSGFWNGAVVIAALLLLAGFAVASLHRLEYLALAVIAVALGYAQNRLFLGPNSLAVKPEVFIGFLAQRPVTPLSVLRYYVDLLGLLPVIAVAGAALVPSLRRAGLGVLLLIALLPWLLANTVKLTPDPAINHKYVLITVVIWNIAAAGFVAHLVQRKRIWSCALALVLAFFLTATGFIDLRAITNRNRRDHAIVVRLDDPLIRWVEANARPREVFLTDWVSLDPVLLSGRRVFFGWPYYAWSAGYDVAGREKIVNAIYGGTNPEEVKRLLRENGLRFIVIDDGNRQQKNYVLQEGFLRSMFPVVFAERDRLILRVTD